MKKLLIFLGSYLLVVCPALFALIVETAHFNEIIHYIKPQTLVILDIDDTLLLPTQTLGTDIWFLYQVKQNEAKGMPYTKAFDKALAAWEAIRHLTNVQLVEIGTEKIIEELQKNNKVMGLTTQGLALTTRTIQQLLSLNIDLSKSAPCKEDQYFINEHGVLYREGLLFTSGTPKGTALIKLLDLIDYCPTHIIFINDKLSHLLDVEKAVIAKGIDFVGLRYSYGDQRLAQFSQEIAEMQWSHSTFDHILSDQEAEVLLNN